MSTDDMICELIKRHEGFSSKAYWDVDGWACGYGCHAPDITETTEWTQQEALMRLVAEVGHCEADVAALLGRASPDGPRLAALVDVRYNEGENGLEKFVKMLTAIRAQDWRTASLELLDSKGADELPARYYEDSLILRTGKLTWK